MPKNFIKRFLPTPETIAEHKILRHFGAVLHDQNLWHWNRNSVARAVSVGIFCAYVPVPFQMLLAASLAVLWRCNLPLSVAMVWVSNPLTMGPMYFAAYELGKFILPMAPSLEPIHHSGWHTLASEINHIWQPLLVGALICGIVGAFLGNLLVRYLWRRMVIHSWRGRQRNRLRNPA